MHIGSPAAGSSEDLVHPLVDQADEQSVAALSVTNDEQTNGFPYFPIGILARIAVGGRNRHTRARAYRAPLETLSRTSSRETSRETRRVTKVALGDPRCLTRRAPRGRSRTNPLTGARGTGRTRRGGLPCRQTNV